MTSNFHANYFSIKRQVPQHFVFSQHLARLYSTRSKKTSFLKDHSAEKNTIFKDRDDSKLQLELQDELLKLHGDFNNIEDLHQKVTDILDREVLTLNQISEVTKAVFLSNNQIIEDIKFAEHLRNLSIDQLIDKTQAVLPLLQHEHFELRTNMTRYSQKSRKRNKEDFKENIDLS